MDASLSSSDASELRIRRTLCTAWRAFWRNPLTIIGTMLITLIVFFAPFVAALILLPLTGQFEEVAPRQYQATTSLGMVLLTVVILGMYSILLVVLPGLFSVGLGALRGHPTNPLRVFRAGGAIWRFLKAAVLLFGGGMLPGVVIMTVVFLLQWPYLEVVFLVLWFPYVIAFYFFLMRFCMAFPLLLETDLGAREALKKSWALTRGRAAKLFGLFIVSALVGYVGMAFFLVGGLVTVPLALLTFLQAYRTLIGEGEAPTETATP